MVGGWVGGWIICMYVYMYGWLGGWVDWWAWADGKEETERTPHMCTQRGDGDLLLLMLMILHHIVPST